MDQNVNNLTSTKILLHGIMTGSAMEPKTLCQPRDIQ